MVQELFSNAGRGFLSGGITSGQTTLMLNTAVGSSGYPSAISGVSQFRIEFLDGTGEICIVGDTVSSGSWWGNITRGAEGTNQTPHNSYAPFRHPISTAGALGNLVSGLSAASGNIASGQISTYNFASGTTSPESMGLLFYQSGNLYTAITEELISGVRGVHVSQSGYIRIAMASVSGRNPAMGVVIDNIASGIQTNVYAAGTLQIPLTNASGVVDYSGYLGLPIFLGRSGQVVTSSGSFNSGGLVLSSGDIVQSLGNVGTNSGQINLLIDPVQFNQIQSGNIASGVISQMHLSSGAVNSGKIGNNSITSGNISSGSIGQFHLSSGVLNSGQIADNSIVSGSIASGQVGQFHMSSGAIVSGMLGNQSVTSGNIASGSIRQIHISNGGVRSGGISSGEVGRMHHSSGAINSGHVSSGAILGQDGGGAFTVASGTLGIYDHSSGFVARATQFVTPIQSGTSWQLITGELISGVRGVSISQSGFVQIAMAAVSGRMPAVGVVWDNVQSGINCNIYTKGLYQFSSGLFVVSGSINFIGCPVWLGRSGQICSISGSFNSGGHASGDIGQKFGISINSGGVLFDVCIDSTFSGGPLGQAAGGQNV